MSWIANSQEQVINHEQTYLTYEDFCQRESRASPRNLKEVQRIEVLSEACDEVVRSDAKRESAAGELSSSVDVSARPQPEQGQYDPQIEMIEVAEDLCTSSSQTRTYPSLPSICNTQQSFEDSAHLEIQKLVSSNIIRPASTLYSSEASPAELNAGIIPMACPHPVLHQLRSNAEAFPYAQNMHTIAYPTYDHGDIHYQFPSNTQRYPYQDQIYTASTTQSFSELATNAGCETEISNDNVPIPQCTKYITYMSLPALNLQSYTKDYRNTYSSMTRVGHFATSSIRRGISKMPSDRKKLCSVEGCKSQARAYNRCKRHGGSKRCAFSGCTKSVQSRGLCIRHGGGSRCQEPGCTRASQSHGRCKMHGGGRPCLVHGCEKKAHLKRLCRRHGGGAKCCFLGCEKWAQRQGMCMTHSKHTKGVTAHTNPYTSAYHFGIDNGSLYEMNRF